MPDPGARHVDTRRQVRGSTRFKRAEGIWHDDGLVYVSTTGDEPRLRVRHRARAHRGDLRRPRAGKPTPLLRVDQLTANRAGEVFVCEDIATNEIDIGLIDRAGRVSKFLSVTGPDHVGSELTGVTFDPSGSRMYFSSQRAFGKDDGLPGPGAIYEVSGPIQGLGLNDSLLPGAAAFVAAILVALLGLVRERRATAVRRVERRRRRRLVKLRLLGVNDLHGHLEAPRPGLGGAAWLKAHLDRATVPGRTIRVHAGDMIGATPLISSWFHDEPTMEAGNELGLRRRDARQPRVRRGRRRADPDAARRPADRPGGAASATRTAAW